jgi:hypothetical protein
MARAAGFIAITMEFYGGKKKTTPKFTVDRGGLS